MDRWACFAVGNVRRLWAVSRAVGWAVARRQCSQAVGCWACFAVGSLAQAMVGCLTQDVGCWVGCWACLLAGCWVGCLAGCWACFAVGGLAQAMFAGSRRQCSQAHAGCGLSRAGNVRRLWSVSRRLWVAGLVWLCSQWAAGPALQWAAGPALQWTAGPALQWTAGPALQWTVSRRLCSQARAGNVRSSKPGSGLLGLLCSGLLGLLCSGLLGLLCSGLLGLQLPTIAHHCTARAGYVRSRKPGSRRLCSQQPAQQPAQQWWVAMVGSNGEGGQC